MDIILDRRQNLYQDLKKKKKKKKQDTKSSYKTTFGFPSSNRSINEIIKLSFKVVFEASHQLSIR